MKILTISMEIRCVCIFIRKLFYSRFLSQKNILVFKMSEVISLDFMKIFPVSGTRVRFKKIFTISQIWFSNQIFLFNIAKHIIVPDFKVLRFFSLKVRICMSVPSKGVPSITEIIHKNMMNKQHVLKTKP